MRRDWQGLIKILEINIKDKDGTILWQDFNLYNILHTDGTEFILNAVFLGGPTNSYIPNSYYFGLDARTSLAAADVTADLIGEPTSPTGYLRQSVSSTGQFSITTVVGVKQALSPIITFGATTSWGPVRNLFLTDKSNNDGSLIASVALSTPASITAGQSLNLRLGLSLKDCP